MMNNTNTETVAAPTTAATAVTIVTSSLNWLSTPDVDGAVRGTIMTQDVDLLSYSGTPTC